MTPHAKYIIFVRLAYRLPTSISEKATKNTRKGNSNIILPFFPLRLMETSTMIHVVKVVRAKGRV